MVIDGKNKTSNSIIIPIPPKANAGYPINLFLAISDMSSIPAPIMRSIVTNSYIPINFEIAEISTKACSYLFFQFALYILDLTMNHLLFCRHAECQYEICI
jgi:hypothetical protein